MKFLSLKGCSFKLIFMGKNIMINLNLKNKLIKFIESLNIFCYGFTECRRFIELKQYFNSKIDKLYLTEFEDKDVEKRINPFFYFEDGKTIISIAVPYFRKDNEYNKCFSKYTQGLDYHYVVNDYLNKICDFIRNFGYECKSFCDTNNLPERYIAYLCGVGHIGRNSLLYTKKYGSYVFLGEIITNANLCDSFSQEYYDNKFKEIGVFEHCGKCRNCMKKCPNDVLVEKNFNKCVSNLTQKKVLDSDEINNLNGMIFGCDICQDVCPKNRNVEYSFEERFNTEEFLKNIKDNDIVNMNNKFFKDNFKKLSCSWRGKNLLKRNVIIKNKEDINFIKSLNFDNNEYLNYYKNRFFNKKN